MMNVLYFHNLCHYHKWWIYWWICGKQKVWIFDLMNMNFKKSSRTLKMTQTPITTDAASVMYAVVLGVRV